VDTWRDYETAEWNPSPAYPLPVDPRSLSIHEESLLDSLPAGDVPIVVEAWTCMVLDGRYRLERAKEERRSILALPVDYRVVEMPNANAPARTDVDLPRLPRMTWRTYKLAHVHQLSATVFACRAPKPLRCEPLRAI